MAGNTTATRKLLRETGNGSIAALPAWDTLVAGDLPAHTHAGTDVTSAAPINVLKSAAAIGTRRGINLIEGTNVALTMADDAGNDRVNITIAASAGGGSNHNLLSGTHTDTVAASPVLGDLIAGNATPAWQRVAGNVTATRKFLRQTGTGTVGALPAWGNARFRGSARSQPRCHRHQLGDPGSRAWRHRQRPVRNPSGLPETGRCGFRGHGGRARGRRHSGA